MMIRLRNASVMVVVMALGIEPVGFHKEALATPWNLPQAITDENVTVRFAVDSTWHLVEGKTSGLHGKIWLHDPSDPLSIRIDAGIPVARFDTERESRDEKLRKVMHAEQFPEVRFSGQKASPLGGACEPSMLMDGAMCRLDIEGELRIGAVSKTVVLPVEVKKSAKGLVVEGELALEWADYGVEDPSILIAKLDKTVRVHVSVVIPQEVLYH